MTRTERTPRPYTFRVRNRRTREVSEVTVMAVSPFTAMQPYRETHEAVTWPQTSSNNYFANNTRSMSVR